MTVMPRSSHNDWRGQRAISGVEVRLSLQMRITTASACPCARGVVPAQSVHHGHHRKLQPHSYLEVLLRRAPAQQRELNLFADWIGQHDWAKPKAE